MKKFLTFLFLVGILFLTFNYRDKIVGYTMKNFIDKGNLVMGDANSYFKDIDYAFVQNTDNLSPSNQQDLLNIIYTTLNKGLDEITFYCDDHYESCIDDVSRIADNSDYLSTINNLVHPYNSYKNIYFTMNNYGRVNIKIKKIYSDSDILLINNEIKRITSSIFYDGVTDYDKIKLFHDYIINNTVYDDTVSLENQVYSDTNSSNAMGLLFEGRAICSGYSDTMAIFLSSEGFNNYKISSDEHIWNLIYYNDKWLHIDATWDDPVTSDGSNVLYSDFLLIDTNKLNELELKLNKSEHDFDKSLYIEASY